MRVGRGEESTRCREPFDFMWEVYTLSKKRLITALQYAKMIQEKLIFGFPKSCFKVCKHIHTVICFIQCWIISPFIYLFPPIHKVSIYYRLISFDIPTTYPALCVNPLTLLPNRLLNSSRAAHGAGQQEIWAISLKLKALLHLPTVRACWDRLLLISP